MQIAWPGGLAIVDPMAVDVAPLAPVLAGPGTLIAHAGDQDLTILERAVSAAGAPVRHADRRGLWATARRRSHIVRAIPRCASERAIGSPTGPAAVDPTSVRASDVEHLAALHDALVERLTELGRLEWARDECEERRLRAHGRPDPATAWWRIKGSRQLRGKARGVAQEVAAWREREAERADLPPRFVLPDLALASIVQRAPTTREDLMAVRGLDGRHVQMVTASATLGGGFETGVAWSNNEFRLPESDASDWHCPRSR